VIASFYRGPNGLLITVLNTSDQPQRASLQANEGVLGRAVNTPHTFVYDPLTDKVTATTGLPQINLDPYMARLILISDSLTWE